MPGVDHITFGLPGSWELRSCVRHSCAISPAAICDVFGIDPQRVNDHVELEPALAIKFTTVRAGARDSLGDGDLSAASTMPR